MSRSPLVSCGMCVCQWCHEFQVYIDAVVITSLDTSRDVLHPVLPVCLYACISKYLDLDRHLQSFSRALHQRNSSSRSGFERSPKVF